MTYLLLLPILYLLVCVILYFQQDNMLFFPARDSTAQLEQAAHLAGLEAWRNAAGQQIGWRSREGDPQKALLLVHGNGGYALHRAYYLDYARVAGNPRVYLLEYPGYGSRDGQPSEKSLTSAAVEAIDTLTADRASRLWLVGESLGTGVACAAVKARGDRIAGLILVTPFNSLVAAASSHYPWLPVSVLLRTRFDSQKNLAMYPGPVAVVVAERDSVIPPRLGRKLYEDYSGRKHLWTAPDSDHDVHHFLDRNWAEIFNWVVANQI